MYKVGDVLRVTQPYSFTGTDKKCRWFVFLGRCHFAENPRNIFLCTTTTQLEKYRINKASVCVEFKADNSCFDRDCLLCLDELEDSFTEDAFISRFQPETKGNVGLYKLQEILQKLRQADVSPRIVQDIIDSFRLDEIPTCK